MITLDRDKVIALLVGTFVVGMVIGSILTKVLL